MNLVNLVADNASAEKMVEEVSICSTHRFSKSSVDVKRFSSLSFGERVLQWFLSASFQLHRKGAWRYHAKCLLVGCDISTNDL